MGNINMNQIYLWKKNSVFTYPWQRQFLNVDFLKYEQKRIKEVAKWYTKFQKSKLGEELEEVYYYVTPVELSSEWKATIVSKGDYNYVGLSALKNCLQIQLLMLISKEKALPKEYSLIRITKSKKDYIHDERNNEAQYVIIVEDFEEVDSSHIYIDVPFEKRIISKFIKENMINDELIANSFQPTISGSPYVVNGKGGISFSTFLRKSSFSDELINTLKLMQPLEFTDLQFKLPLKLIEGQKMFSFEGSKFKVAEKGILGKNYFTAFSSNNYDQLNSELIKRDIFNGEYSIASSLTPRGSEGSELLRDILSKFVKTEIMHPFNSDELKYLDVDLSIVQKRIDEDLWLQVVNQKQLKPIIISDSPYLIKLRKSLIIEWKAILESLGLKKNVDHEVRAYSNTAYNNILRVAQSMARDEQLNAVNDSILDRSLKLFTENADSLINNPEIQHNAKVVIPEMYESAKFNAIRAELSINLLDTKGLFENVKGEFKDIYELQDYIDQKLLPRGFIFEPRRGFYKWI